MTWICFSYFCKHNQTFLVWVIEYLRAIVTLFSIYGSVVGAIPSTLHCRVRLSRWVVGVLYSAALYTHLFNCYLNILCARKLKLNVPIIPNQCMLSHTDYDCWPCFTYKNPQNKQNPWGFHVALPNTVN